MSEWVLQCLLLRKKKFNAPIDHTIWPPSLTCRGEDRGIVARPETASASGLDARIEPAAA
jgi:hypothetical protein